MAALCSFWCCIAAFFFSRDTTAALLRFSTEALADAPADADAPVDALASRGADAAPAAAQQAGAQAAAQAASEEESAAVVALGPDHSTLALNVTMAQFSVVMNTPTGPLAHFFMSDLSVRVAMQATAMELVASQGSIGFDDLSPRGQMPGGWPHFIRGGDAAADAEVAAVTASAGRGRGYVRYAT